MPETTMLTQPPSTSVSGNINNKNTTIILPGDKKPKSIGGGRKPEIKADVVSVVFIDLNHSKATNHAIIINFLFFISKKKGCA